MPSDQLFIEVPRLEKSPAREAAFDDQWNHLRSGGRYGLAEEKHVFLRWLIATEPVLLHGANREGIETFEPRNQTDYAGDPAHAVFATSDGIWPIYFAIADRRVVRSLINDCVHHSDGARYFFSVAPVPADAPPWTRGVVYVLPRAPFRVSHGSAEWTSATAVDSLAELPVEPDDFPFLDRVHRHELHETEPELHARLRAELA